MKKGLLSITLLTISITCMSQGFPIPTGPSEESYSKCWKDVNYANDGKEYHNMDIYLPKSEKSDPCKVVIVIYGSAWFANNMKGITMASIGVPLLNAGFAVATINHRSSSDAAWPAQIQDVKAAIRFVRACATDYNIDASFIGISGFSSGGHLSTYAAVTNGMKQVQSGELKIDIEGSIGEHTNTDSHVDGVVDWFGPVDMAHLSNCNEPKDQSSPEAALIGGRDPRQEPDWVKVISPVNYVGADAPEILIIHGDSDGVVPCCQSSYLKEAYDKAGAKSRLVIVPGGGHGPVCFSDEYYKLMTDYFIEQSSRAK